MSCQLPATSYQLPVTSCQLPVTSYQHVPLSEAGGRHSPVARRLSPDPRDTVRFPWTG